MIKLSKQTALLLAVLVRQLTLNDTLRNVIQAFFDRAHEEGSLDFDISQCVEVNLDNLDEFIEVIKDLLNQEEEEEDSEILIDFVAQTLTSGWSRNRLSGPQLESLRRKVLVPAELAKWRAELDTSLRCLCGHVFHNNEAVVLSGVPREPIVQCARCAVLRHKRCIAFDCRELVRVGVDYCEAHQRGGEILREDDEPVEVPRRARIDPVPFDPIVAPLDMMDEDDEE